MSQEKIKLEGGKEGVIEFTIYSPDFLPTKGAAADISRLFVENYPTAHSEEQKKADTARYETAEQIQEQVKSGNVFISVAINGETVGFLKIRIENRSNIPNSEEWLGSWIIVDKRFRRFGIGERLLEESIRFLQGKKKNDSEKRIFYIGDVHKDNAASRGLLKKHGFKEEPGKSDDFLLARREIFAEEEEAPQGGN